MSDNKEYFTHSEEMGTIHISEEVLAGIAAASVLEVEGVGGLSANLGTDLAELLGKKNLGKGVRIVTDETGITVQVSAMVNYGTTIPTIAAAIQENVKNAVEAMSGFSVHAVNVTIAGVIFPQKS